MKLSFRNRIALFTAAATIGQVFFVVYGVVYFTAYNHLDDDIRQEKEEVLKNLRWAGNSILIEYMSEWEEKEQQQVEVNPTFLQRVESGRIPVNRTTVPLHTLFNTLKEIWQPSLLEKNMELRLQIPIAAQLTTEGALGLFSLVTF